MEGDEEVGAVRERTLNATVQAALSDFIDFSHPMFTSDCEGQPLHQPKPIT